MAELYAGRISMASFGIQKLLFKKILAPFCGQAFTEAFGNVTSFRVHFLLSKSGSRAHQETFKPQSCPLHAPMGVCVALSLFQILGAKCCDSDLFGIAESSPSYVGTPPE